MRTGAPIRLSMITNRGVKVWPQGFPETTRTDHWRCRFLADRPIRPEEVLAVQAAAVGAGLDVIKTENLYTFDGELGFSVAQGE